MADETTETAVVLPTRDDIRASIFKTKQPKRKEITFFGHKIELRQSTLGDIIAATMKENQEAAVVEVLLNSAYVPGTDEKIFTPEDRDSLLQLPFGKDFSDVNQGMLELTNVNFLDKGSS